MWCDRRQFVEYPHRRRNPCAIEQRDGQSCLNGSRHHAGRRAAHNHTPMPSRPGQCIDHSLTIRAIGGMQRQRQWPVSLQRQRTASGPHRRSHRERCLARFPRGLNHQREMQPITANLFRQRLTGSGRDLQFHRGKTVGKPRQNMAYHMGSVLIRQPNLIWPLSGAPCSSRRISSWALSSPSVEASSLWPSGVNATD